MRFVSVLGAVGVGLVLGSAAVLAPLALGTSWSKSAWQTTAGWSAFSVRQMQSMVAFITPSGSAERTSTAAIQTRQPAVTSTPAKSEAAIPGQEAKTFAYLSHPGSDDTVTTADAKIVQSPWTTQVTLADAASAPKKQTSSKPASDQQRQTLVRDLQAELKRVGCYEGEPNGQWGAASKKAMAAFTDRVNASLPFDEPDFILLTLVQGHKGRACGQSCPAGQSLADNGRCTPNSILAQAERVKQGDHVRREPALTARDTDVATAKSPVPDGAGLGSVASAWSPKTVEPPLQTGSTGASVPAPVRVIRPQPSAAVVASTTAPPEVTVRSAPALPGRMTVGAPLPAIVAAPAPSASVVPAPALAKPARQVAAANPTPADNTAAEPVTAARPVAEEPAPHAQRRAARNDDDARAAPRPKRAPEPVVVHRPQPPAKVYVPQYANNANSNANGGSKSRRLVYEMFQRPDRN